MVAEAQILQATNNEQRATNNEQRATNNEQRATNNEQRIMQNKPNFRKSQMNVNIVITKDYESQGRLQTPGKQTQSNPISKAAPMLSRLSCPNRPF